MRVQLELMIELALVAGMRKLEIFSVSVDDIHPDNFYIVAHGKRQDQHEKVREIPYADSTRELVREWFRLRAYVGATGSSPWMSVTGPDPAGPLYWKRMAILLHFGSGWRWHRFRHTCATERLRAGMELHELQRFLGHSRLEQTLAYAKLVREDIHRAASRTDDAFQRAIRPAA
jgi:integrase